MPRGIPRAGTRKPARSAVRLTPEQRAALRAQYRAGLRTLGLDPDERVNAGYARAAGVGLREAGLPTMGELAARYGVSVCTASYIIRGLPSTGGWQQRRERERAVRA